MRTWLLGNCVGRDDWPQSKEAKRKALLKYTVIMYRLDDQQKDHEDDREEDGKLAEFAPGLLTFNL